MNDFCKQLKQMLSMDIEKRRNFAAEDLGYSHFVIS